MKDSKESITEEHKLVLPAENQKGIENHKKAAMHHEFAAKLHHEAIMHHEAGEHYKAAQSTVKAQGHLVHAIEAVNEDCKHHIANN